MDVEVGPACASGDRPETPESSGIELDWLVLVVGWRFPGVYFTQKQKICIQIKTKNMMCCVEIVDVSV